MSMQNLGGCGSCASAVRGAVISVDRRRARQSRFRSSPCSAVPSIVSASLISFVRGAEAMVSVRGASTHRWRCQSSGRRVPRLDAAVPNRRRFPARTDRKLRFLRCTGRATPQAAAAFRVHDRMSARQHHGERSRLLRPRQTARDRLTRRCGRVGGRGAVLSSNRRGSGGTRTERPTARVRNLTASGNRVADHPSSPARWRVRTAGDGPNACYREHLAAP